MQISPIKTAKIGSHVKTDQSFVVLLTELPRLGTNGCWYIVGKRLIKSTGRYRDPDHYVYGEG